MHKCAVAAFAACVFASPAARAQQADTRNQATPSIETTPPTSDTKGELPVTPKPQSPRSPFLQYGVAFTAEFAPGTFCQAPQLNCVLGSGGGVAGRVGWRSTGRWYLGGAYELSKQDASKLYLLPILQQLRGEARYYFDNGHDTVPFFSGGLGVAGYGDTWAVSTWGPAAFAAVGVESQTWSGPILGVSIGYRPMWFQQFSVGEQTRGPGFAHMISLDLTLEAREPL